MDPSVNHAIRGRFEYGTGCTVSEGCNLVVSDGACLTLGDRCRIGRYVELGPLGTIRIGDGTSIQDRSIMLGDVTLGRYCVLSLNVLITSGTHYYDRWPELLIRDQDARVMADQEMAARHSRPIVLGEDCWVGINAVVMPGVSVGRGCVIGANAVVTKDLDPYCVAAGVPARVIKRRLEFAPPERIDWRQHRHYPYFYAGFRLAGPELEHNKALGGHVTGRHFALWLAARGRGELRFLARSVSGGETVLSSQDVQAIVTAEWTQCRFPATSVDAPAWFTANEGEVAISEAWVQ